jgi:hypothetical protein
VRICLESRTRGLIYLVLALSHLRRLFTMQAQPRGTFPDGSDVRVSSCDGNLLGSFERLSCSLCPPGIAKSASMGGMFP